MSVHISKDFIKGMHFTKTRNIKKLDNVKRKNTVDESWKQTGKYLYEAIEKYEKGRIKK